MRPTDDEIANVWSLHMDGCSDNEIALAHGKSIDWVPWVLEFGRGMFAYVTLQAS